ncbi:nuclease A inhibitor family protein [Fimbriiglobus ruber]|uniref:Nuclease n=1 Tax=Fimbriiglobus ruber TaxID=1908690 RepID=A0A225E9K2_9BACT|nr:nuclease A inhibitor family protein [Fimbriiglobus ruber]OWK46726.1 nuclease [Fimbriiglobus ruber]
MATSEAEAALHHAADGLTYQSEADSPWAVFHWPTAAGKPTPAGVRTQGGHKGTIVTEQQTLNDFFAPLVQLQDWYGDEEKAIAQRYQALLDTVQKFLTDSIIVRVGRRKVAVYVVGATREGGWAGLKTMAVET